MNFDTLFFFELFPDLIPSVPITISMAVVAFIFAFIIGTLIAIVKIFNIPVLTQLLNIYVSFFRCTPLIAQVFFFYYGLTTMIPELSSISPIAAFIFVDSLNEAAFMSETFRGAFNSVDKGQYEAALSVGMTEGKAIRRIIFPQALRVAVPGLSNSFIGLIKSTAIGFTIGVLELMGQAQLIAASTYRVMESYVAVLIIYWVVVGLLVQLQKVFEKNLSKGHQ